VVIFGNGAPCVNDPPVLVEGVARVAGVGVKSAAVAIFIYLLGTLVGSSLWAVFYQ
jgi:hypothetical protein